jgi:hypothetical protein
VNRERLASLERPGNRGKEESFHHRFTAPPKRFTAPGAFQSFHAFHAFHQRGGACET